MDDPQSSNPLEAVLDAGSEVAGNAIGALIDPFGSSTESTSEDDRNEEPDTAEQIDASADDNEDSLDEDEDSDDDYDDYDDGVGEQSGEYTTAPQRPTVETTKYYESSPSESPKHSYKPSTFNTFSNHSSAARDTSDASFSELFGGLGKSILLGLFLYPVVGLGGCITRLVVQGSPPHPMYQEQAHDQWLNSPIQSWTTEAVIIPLAIIAITFFRRLITIRHANPTITYFLLVVGGVATIGVGIGLTKTFRKESRGTSTTVNASSQAVGTAREVNAIKLNMRSGPGSNYPVVATFSKKTRIVSYGETRKVNGELWTQASTPDGQTRGWVNLKFLSP